ncbi:MAG: ATP-binding protein [Gammaproteobacteria bacterium]|nr:ATP-binding protein [Gammaproteobacteria bacterium]
MFKTLSAKLAAVLLGLLCLIGALYIALTLFSTQMYQQEATQKLNWTLAEHLVAEKTLMLEDRVNEGALNELFKMLMVINPNIEIYLLDRSGTILACSVPTEQLQRKRVGLEPLQRFMRGVEAAPLLGDDPRAVQGGKIFSVAPVSVGGATQGYLYVVLEGQAYDSIAQMRQGSYILHLSMWAIGASLLLTLMAGLLLFRYLTRRLARLADAMDNFQHAEFFDTQATKIAVKTSQLAQGDEIDRLGASFNQMAHRITEQVTHLRQTDSLRRELVANVSHDLRTPLAALQGYLETLLLKEGELTPGEQRHYIEIACRHSERLGRLVAELFDLAKLDSGVTLLQAESFALGELVQDVAQKYQLAAENKQIQIEVRCDADLPFVHADIGLIERVLANLIENALRYTPQNGTVTVHVIRREGVVRVQVGDTGCGIAAEDIPYIFDRFYRVEKTRQAHAGGTGLGLAIAKRILDLHGSLIEVQSEPGKGARFSFDLECAA